MFMLVNKPPGVSSFRFINSLKCKLRVKKIGHTGTLDPLASGLLLVATNGDTKLIPYVQGDFKTYVVSVQLGFETMSFDLGTPVVFQSEKSVQPQELKNALQHFTGWFYQTPPQVSAKKIKGERAYKAARQNKRVELKPTLVCVPRVFLLHYCFPFFTFSVTMSKGAYVRALVRDVARLLNNYATVVNLVRTRIGSLTFADVGSNLPFNKVLTIFVSCPKSLSPGVLKLLANGCPTFNKYSKRTLLAHNNKPLAVVYKNHPERVWPANITGILEKSGV